MKNVLLRIRLFLLLALLASPRAAHADGYDVRDIALGLVTKFWPVWTTIAILVLVVTGFTLVITTDESRAEKAKSTIIAVVIGGIITTIMLVLGYQAYIGILYNGQGSLVPNPVGVFGNYNAISIQAAGIADWLSVISVMLGIVFIIIAALRAVSSFGDEGKYETARNAVFHAVAGFVIIASAYILKAVFYDVRTPNLLIAFVASKILIVLAIITTIAVAILIYAGLRMIVSLGDEAQYEAAKSLVIRVVIGLLIILLSYALVIVIANIF